MSEEDKLEMVETALPYLERHSTLKWAHSFLKDLKRSHQPTNLSYFMGATYGRRRLIRSNMDFTHVDESVVQ